MAGMNYCNDRGVRGPKLWPRLATLICAAVLIWHVWPRQRNGIDPDAAPRAITPRGELAAEEKTSTAIFRQASPSVVYITTLATEHNPFSFDIQQIPQGTGSGFVWDRRGHIVTNFHVIQGAEASQVTLADHSTWNARLVAPTRQRPGRARN